jgi:hypothetical protein
MPDTSNFRCFSFLIIAISQKTSPKMAEIRLIAGVAPARQGALGNTHEHLIEDPGAFLNTLNSWLDKLGYPESDLATQDTPGLEGETSHAEKNINLVTQKKLSTSFHLTSVFRLSLRTVPRCRQH